MEYIVFYKTPTGGYGGLLFESKHIKATSLAVRKAAQDSLPEGYKIVKIKKN